MALESADDPVAYTPLAKHAGQPIQLPVRLHHHGAKTQ